MRLKLAVCFDSVTRIHLTLEMSSILVKDNICKIRTFLEKLPVMERNNAFNYLTVTL